MIFSIVLTEIRPESDEPQSVIDPLADFFCFKYLES